MLWCCGRSPVDVGMLHVAPLPVGLHRRWCAPTEAVRLTPAHPVHSFDIVAFCASAACRADLAAKIRDSSLVLLAPLPARCCALGSLLQLILAPLNVSLLRPHCAFANPTLPVLPVASVMIVAFCISSVCPVKLVMHTCNPPMWRWAGQGGASCTAWRTAHRQR